MSSFRDHTTRSTHRENPNNFQSALLLFPYVYYCWLYGRYDIGVCTVERSINDHRNHVIIRSV